MQQNYQFEENGNSDHSNNKSAVSTCWEEICRSPINLEKFVDSCLNPPKPIEIDNDDSKESQINSLLFDSHLKNNERDGIIQTKPQVSVKARVQQYTQCTNGYSKIDDKGKWYLVVREIIDTEKVYVRSLTEVEEGYLKLPDSVFTNNEEVKVIFSNWKKLRLFHSNFLDQISSIKSYEFYGLFKLSQCFIDEVEQFEDLYSEYCTNYSQSVKHLHHIETTSSDTWKSLIHCQTQIGHQLPLSTFLLKPVQRILKYHLLLKELIQCCKSIQHANITEIIESLFQALQNMIQVANRINERQMEREEQLRRLKLRDELYSDILSSMLNCPDLGQPYLDGDLKVPGCKNFRFVMLCQNALILAKRLSSGKWDIKHVIKCNQMMLFEYIPKQPLEFHVVDINDNKNKVTLQTLNSEDKEIWCKMIKQLIISTFETDSISERAKRILLDKKSNVLAQNQSTNQEVLDKFHISLHREDYESSCLLDLISSPTFIPMKHKNIKRRNSVGAIKSESKINFRDPSIYQWSPRRQYRNDDDIDCRSIMIDVNEENIREKHGQENSVHEHTYERYIEKSRNKLRLTPDDLKEILQPPEIMQESADNSNVLLAEMEQASICSDPDLDSVASDNTALSEHKRKSTSMDRNFGISLYTKANSFTNNIDTGNPSSGEFINSSHRKKPLFSSVRETKTTRSNSDWGSLFDVEARSGLVKRFFRASAKLAKRDKSKTNTGQFENNNIRPLDQSSPSKSANSCESKRIINKSNSIDYIVQPQCYLQKSNSKKKYTAPPAPISIINYSNDNERTQDNSDRPLKPPRLLPQFRIEMFDKMHLPSPEQSRTNENHSSSVNTSDKFVQNTSNSEFGNPYKVKDLVSIFQSDR